MVMEVNRLEAKRRAGGPGVTAELVGEVIKSPPCHGKGCERWMETKSRDSKQSVA